MNKKYYVTLNALIINATIFAQGVDFPSSPEQAPIGGLGLLAAGGAALAYKKLRKKINLPPINQVVTHLLLLN